LGASFSESSRKRYEAELAEHEAKRSADPTHTRYAEVAEKGGAEFAEVLKRDFGLTVHPFDPKAKRKPAYSED
jgi:hypothetical protein